VVAQVASVPASVLNEVGVGTASAKTDDDHRTGADDRW
jgi:hypothetical protein